MRRLLIAACVVFSTSFNVSIAVEARKVRPSAPDDESIVRTVLNRLSGRPGLDVSAVSATSQSGSLVLTGRVRTIFEQREVERLAAGVPGVVALANRLEVQGLETPDSALEVEADRALGAMPRLRGFRIQVSVAGAVLTLVGEVPLARDRFDAEESVSRVAGIVGIHNELRVAPYPIDPDRLRKRIEALLQDKLVFGAVEELVVKVGPPGEVTLLGIVFSNADRQRAERIVYGVRGVVAVTNELTTRPETRPSP